MSDQSDDIDVSIFEGVEYDQPPAFKPEPIPPHECCPCPKYEECEEEHVVRKWNELPVINLRLNSERYRGVLYEENDYGVMDAISIKHDGDGVTQLAAEIRKAVKKGWKEHSHCEHMEVRVQILGWQKDPS